MSILMYLKFSLTFCGSNQEFSVVRKFIVFSVKNLILKTPNKPGQNPFLL